MWLDLQQQRRRARQRPGRVDRGRRRLPLGSSVYSSLLLLLSLSLSLSLLLLFHVDESPFCVDSFIKRKTAIHHTSKCSYYDLVDHACHILPPSEIDSGRFGAVFAGSGGKYLFHRIG